MRTPPVTDYDAWYDASDYASITLTSGKVSQWNDQSANARHLTQVTVAQQPAYGARLLNNIVIPDFASSSLVASGLTISAPATFIVVGVPDNVAGESCVCSPDLDPGWRMEIYQSAFTAYTGSQVKIGGYLPQNGVAFCQGLAVNSSRNMRMLANGYLETPAGTVAVSSAAFRFGDRTNGGTGQAFDGGLAECLVWLRALTDAEMLSTYSYLRAKWGTP